MAPFLLDASDEVPVYFKSDEVSKARDLLMVTAEYRDDLRQEREQRLALGETPQVSSSALRLHLQKPIPYSRDLQKLQAEKRELEDKLDGVGIKLTTIIEREHMRQRLVSINEELRKMQRGINVGPAPQDVRQATFLPSYRSRDSIPLQQYPLVPQERVLITRDDFEKRKEAIDKQLSGVGVPTINAMQKHELRLELEKIEETLKTMPVTTPKRTF